MKYSIIITFYFLCYSFFEIKAEDTVYIDSVKFVNPLYGIYYEDSVKTEEPQIYVDYNIFTGVYINNTFGIHPIFNIPFGIFYADNFFNLDYEFRFGNSQKSYNVLENDTLKSTRFFSAQYFGFEYGRLLFKSDYHFLSLNLGIGYNWINIPQSNSILTLRTIDGLGINFGLGYSYHIHKRRGPYMLLMYHFSDLKNNGGTKLNDNSFILRITYGFGPDRIY